MVLQPHRLTFLGSRYRQTGHGRTRADVLIFSEPAGRLCDEAGAVGASRWTSVCSAISRASSTSMPRYLTVLSILVWPSKSWTARKFFVRRYIKDALVRRIVCVPYVVGSSPIDRTHPSTTRAYCRMEKCGALCSRLGAGHLHQSPDHCSCSFPAS